MNGLPNLWEQLRAVDFDVTGPIADQVVNVPEGTVVTDAANGALHYVFKPLVTRQYLLAVQDPGNLSLGDADGLSLDDVPAYAPVAMGDAPSAPLKYSEGEPVP